MKTKENNLLRATRMDANTWMQAGNAECDIDLQLLENRFGKIKASTWEGVCRFVYEKLTGNKMLECPMRGNGSRSRWHGEQVAAVWKD